MQHPPSAKHEATRLVAIQTAMGQRAASRLFSAAHPYLRTSTIQFATDASVVANVVPEGVSRRCVLGLGNPGTKYVGTRHNIGFMVVERFAEQFAPAMQARWPGGPENKLGWETQSQISAEVFVAGVAFEEDHPKLGHDLVDQISERRRDRTRREGVPHPRVELTLAMPQTYMNLSGTTAKKFAEQRRFRLTGSRDQFLVICDDVTVPFGQLRLKVGVSKSLTSRPPRNL